MGSTVIHTIGNSRLTAVRLHTDVTDTHYQCLPYDSMASGMSDCVLHVSSHVIDAALMTEKFGQLSTEIF